MKRIIVLGVVVLIVIAGWSAAWLWGASQINAYQRQLANADGATSLKLSCGSFGVGGYPFGFDLTCTTATMTMADTTVTANGLKASVLVYNPFHVLVFAQSPVNVADAFTGSQSRVDFASLEGSARLQDWRIGRVSLVVEQPVWNDTVLEDRLLAKADHAELQVVDLPDLHDAKAGLAALGEYVELDNVTAPGFQIAAGKTTFEGELSNVPDDVRTYGDPDLIKRWQAANGAFKLIGFKGADAAGDNFTATGNASLDAGGHINGQLKLNSKGVVERVGTLVPDQMRGLIIGPQAADGSYSQTINVAAGVVFAGLVPVTVLSPVF